MRSIDLPIASAVEYANSRWAPSFHDRMMPSSVVLTMASSEAATMADSSDRVSSSRFCCVTSNMKQRL